MRGRLRAQDGGARAPQRCCTAEVTLKHFWRQFRLGSLQVECDVLAARGESPITAAASAAAAAATDASSPGMMGSKLSRQRSLDFESKLSRRRRPKNESPPESERGGRDLLFTSLMLRSDKLPGMLRRTNHSPYVRRVAWIREIQRLLREKKTEQAAEVLKLLRKVRGCRLGAPARRPVPLEMMLTERCGFRR